MSESSPPPDPDTKLMLAYVGDRYSRQDLAENLFAADVAVFEKARAADSLWKRYASAFGHQEIPLESRVGSGRLRLVANNDVNRCYFDRSADFGYQVGQALMASAAIPGLSAIVVLNNRPNEKDACTAGDLVVFDRLGWRAVPHEFGHLVGGLYDEVTGTRSRPTDVNGPNCGSSGFNAWDPREIGSDVEPGCWQSSSLWNPGQACRMKDGLSNFCAVCRSWLEQLLTSTHKPPPRNKSGKYTQVVFQVFSDHANIVANRVISGPMPTPISRGPLIAGAIDDSATPTVCMGSSFESAFEGRGYVDGKETRGEVESVFSIVNCPGAVDAPQLKRFKFELVTPATNVSPWLTPERFIEGRNRSRRVFDIQ